MANMDTRQKRRSAIHFKLPWRRTTAPTPDGFFTAPDRSQLLYGYSGISLVVAGRTYFTWDPTAKQWKFIVLDVEAHRLIEGGHVQTVGNHYILTIKSGATQVGAGAATGEIWKTSSHATLPDNVLMIGV